MEPVTTAIAIVSGLFALKKAKALYDEHKIDEAQALAEKLKQANMDLDIKDMKKLVGLLSDMAKENKAVLDQHNDMLIRLGEAVQQTASEVLLLRRMIYGLIGAVGLLSVGLVIALSYR